MTDPKSEEFYSEAETVERREATLKVMLATPHKPHKPLGKPGRAEARPSRSRKKDDQ